MGEAVHRRDVMAAFERAFEGDPSRVQIGDFSEFGLVELSRKRTRKPLAEQMSDRCSRCGGEGIVRGLETTAFDLFRSLHAAVEARVEDQSHGLGYLVRTSREVVDRMVGQESARLEHLSTQLECEIRFEVGQDCGPGEFTLTELPDPQSH
jgi:ribonuclease G